jgi:cytochrome P450
MTAATRSVPVIDFDHHSEEFARDLEGRARNLLEHPIAYTESNGGHYVVTSHELVREVLLDPETYSSGRTTYGAGGLFIPSFPIPLPGGALLPAESDPPRHTDLRKILNPYFTRSACEEMRPQIDAIVAGAIDNIVPPVPPIHAVTRRGADGGKRGMTRRAAEVVLLDGTTGLPRTVLGNKGHGIDAMAIQSRNRSMRFAR